MTIQKSSCVDGITTRGAVYWLRRRVPTEFTAVDPRQIVEISLRTRDLSEARARAHLKWQSLKCGWRAAVAQGNGAATPDAFDAMQVLLDDLNIPYQPMHNLISGPIENLISRIEAIAKFAPNSPHITAALGAIELPHVLISEMPDIIEKMIDSQATPMNDRQRSDKLNRYRHAVPTFIQIIGDKGIDKITERDATNYCNHWQTRVDAKEITADHAVKRVRYARQIIDYYFKRFKVPPSERHNPFKDQKIEKPAYSDDNDRRKLALPLAWVQHQIIDGVGLDGLNPQARDITITAAECGSRQTEIFDLGPDDIQLDHKIPHLMVQIIHQGAYKKLIKNPASKRPLILLGAALDAMRRNPLGFPRYRGNKSYPAAVGSYLHKRDLFPEPPKDETRTYTIGGTRHLFEDRMAAAKMSNEERAYLMGHSIGKVRGRPVYGNSLDLEVRALFQEMVSFPTANWQPRPIAELRSEVDRIAKDLGFRVG